MKKIDHPDSPDIDLLLQQVFPIDNKTTKGRAASTTIKTSSPKRKWLNRRKWDKAPSPATQLSLPTTHKTTKGEEKGCSH